MSARGGRRSVPGRARSGSVLRLGLQPAGSLAERGAQLGPGAGQTFADILGALAQRLGLFPHLLRGLGGAGAGVAEGAFGLALRRAAHLLQLGLSRLLEGERAGFHLVEARLEARHEMACRARRCELAARQAGGRAYRDRARTPTIPCPLGFRFLPIDCRIDRCACLASLEQGSNRDFGALIRQRLIAHPLADPVKSHVSLPPRLGP